MRAEALLPDMIRRAGQSPHAVLEGLDAPLRALGFAPRSTSQGPRAVLWTRGAPRLLFSGHVDVVPVGEGWTRAPHGGELAEGRIWGRGACDMLGGVAAFVGAAALARDAPCAVLLTTDEEIGMRAAEGAIAAGLLDGLESVLVGEPTGFAIGRAEKGVMWLRLSTKGRNAHGSMPELGDNAADRMVRVLRALQDAPNLGRHPLLGVPTRNLGRLASGEAVNQVPASAMAEIDVRYLPGASPEEIVATVREAAKRAGEEVGIEVLSNHAPFETPEDSLLVRACREALREVRGDAPAPIGLPYGTEASKFAPLGLDCVILGPGEQALAHTNRESILVASLHEAERVYARLLEGSARRAA
jgi:succinyl-diaminopimelate desuccinylase